jgi:phosphohistidine phosphatase SixA
MMAMHWQKSSTARLQRWWFVIAMGWLAASAAHGADEALRQILQTPGHVILLRHASAPGTGDPDGFRLDDCGTQRNLSAAGRVEAAEIGAGLRALGVEGATIFSSRWCRCLDTARGLQLGPVTPLPALDSFYADRAVADERTAALKAWLAATDLTRPVVLVTHQVNITALTDVVPAQGEWVVARRSGDRWEVVARRRREGP